MCVRAVLSGQQEEASVMDIALAGEADLKKIVSLLELCISTMLAKSLTCSISIQWPLTLGEAVSSAEVDSCQ